MEDLCDRAGTVDGGTVWSARRNALLCALILAACVAVVYPVGREGYLDDFSYAATALDFARTGHVIFNNWTAPTEGWMIAWGALFIKLFGFSFFTLRMANLPFAMATVYLFHRVLARFGLSQRNASIGALTLGLSPVFFPVALSFMTDVPGLMVILLCVFMCQRAVAARNSKAAILWLVSAALLNVAGGTVRQNAWLGALVMVPSTGWFLRKRRGVLLASVVSAVVSLGLVLALVHWFNGRPNVFIDPVTERVLHYSVRDVLRELTKLGLCLLLLVLPLLAGWWPRARILSRWALLRVAGGLGIMALCLYDAARRGRLYAWLAPWLHNSISNYTGWSSEIYQLFGSPVQLPDWLGVALGLLTLAGALVSAEVFMKTRRHTEPTQSAPSLKSFLWIFCPFCLVNVLLLIPHAQLYSLFDRYTFCFLPFVITLLLLAYQRRFGPAIPIISFVVLAVFTCYSVAAAHDYYADMRAADVAIQELLAAGVPQTSISQSENRDAWLQVQLAGRIHRDGPVELDRGANWVPAVRTPAVPCSTYAASMTPVIQPEYYVVLLPSYCLQPSSFPPVRYRAWLPPFHRSESIEQPIYSRQ